MGITVIPRLIRLRDAPAYLGMDRNRFNAEVRPYLIEIPIGRQGIAFDRLDLDAWIDNYKHCNGRPGKAWKGGKQPWDAKYPQDSSKGGTSGTSKRLSEVNGFEKALERVTSWKPKRT